MALHWSAYACFGVQVVGVILLATAIGVPRLYVNTDQTSWTIGAFQVCNSGTTSNGASYTSCSPFDTSCNAFGVSITSNCSKYNSVRAFFVIAVIAGIITLFVNVVALTALHLKAQGTVWFKFAGLFSGCITGALAIITMIIASTAKDDIVIGSNWNFEASFALLIVSWVLILGGSLSFCFFARDSFTTSTK